MSPAHRFDPSDYHFVRVPTWLARVLYSAFSVIIMTHHRTATGRCSDAGVTVVENRSGKPERILTGGEWDHMTGERRGER